MQMDVKCRLLRTFLPYHNIFSEGLMPKSSTQLVIGSPMWLPTSDLPT